MRRLAALGLAILLLLMAGSIWALGVGTPPRAQCTIGCILDVYPCRDPVTGGPPVVHCPGSAGPGSMLEADLLSRSTAATVLILALAGLGVLTFLWWWTDRGRPRPRPDGDDPPPDDPPLDPIGPSVA